MIEILSEVSIIDIFVTYIEIGVVIGMIYAIACRIFTK